MSPNTALCFTSRDVITSSLQQIHVSMSATLNVSKTTETPCPYSVTVDYIEFSNNSMFLCQLLLNVSKSTTTPCSYTQTVEYIEFFNNSMFLCLLQLDVSKSTTTSCPYFPHLLDVLLHCRTRRQTAAQIHLLHLFSLVWILHREKMMMFPMVVSDGIR